MFQLQEQIVTLEDRLREGQVKLKQAEDNLKLETESQSQMSNRLAPTLLLVFHLQLI